MPTEDGTAPTAVLFDLDGTLIDSRADIAAAANRALSDLGHDALPESTVQTFIGRGAAHLVTRCLESVGATTDEASVADALRRFLGRYDEHLVDRTRPYPHVPETLAALRAAGIRIGIVTNKPEGPARAISNALALGPFEVIVGGDSLETRKPDPQPLTEALARLGVEAADALFVGDSTIDLETARAASVPFLGVSYGIGSPQDLRRAGASVIVNRFDEVLDHLGSGATALRQNGARS